MKKLLYVLLATLPLFMACSKEDEQEPNNPKSETENLLGIWYEARYSEVEQDTVYEIFELYNDVDHEHSASGYALKRTLIQPTQKGYIETSGELIINLKDKTLTTPYFVKNNYYYKKNETDTTYTRYGMTTICTFSYAANYTLANNTLQLQNFTRTPEVGNETEQLYNYNLTPITQQQRNAIKQKTLWGFDERNEKMTTPVWKY